MGVDQGASLVVGIDAEAPSDARGRSLLERYLAGELGGPPQGSLPPLAALGSWVSYHLGPELMGHLAGSAYDGGPYRLVVGRQVLDVELRSGRWLAGPLDEGAVAQAEERCRRALERIGVTAQPRLWLVASES